MNRFTEFAFSEQGYYHVKAGKECQDASGLYSDSEMIIIAVADGHGSDNYPRTAKGSTFAVEAALGAIKEFVDTVKATSIIIDPQQKKELEERMHELEANILRRWHDNVASDIAQNPLQESELTKVSEKYKRRYATGDYDAKAYGTTLVVACVTYDYWFGLQIGDGRCIAFIEDGTSNEPIPWDDTCQSNITTSLCDENAISEFRYCCSKEIPLAVFISSDGVEDSYANMEELHALYRAVVEIFAEHGEIMGKTEVREFLPKASRRGSGDDVSLAGIIRTDIGVEQLRLLKAQGEFALARMRLRQLETDFKTAGEKVSYIAEAMKNAQRSLEETAEKQRRANESYERLGAELITAQKRLEQAKKMLEDAERGETETFQERTAREKAIYKSEGPEAKTTYHEETALREEFMGKWINRQTSAGAESSVKIFCKDGKVIVSKSEHGMCVDETAIISNQNQLAAGNAVYMLEEGNLVEYYYGEGKRVEYIRDIHT